MKLHKIYHPITATPYKYTSDYMEFEPCAPLKPYIRCFWGSRNIVLQKQNTAETYGIVIPDTCMDIIFTADFTNNSLESRFCGIDDRTFIDYQNYRKKKTYFVFAIRFYAWSVSLFAQESMRSTKNAFFDAGYHFPKIKKEIERQLFDTQISISSFQLWKKYCSTFIMKRRKTTFYFRRHQKYYKLEEPCQ